MMKVNPAEGVPLHWQMVDAQIVVAHQGSH